MNDDETAIEPRVPSARRLELAIAEWQRLRASMNDDEDLDADENIIALTLAQANVDDPRDLLARLIDAQVWAEKRAEEAKELQDTFHGRRERYENHDKRLRAIILDVMQAIEIERHRGKLASASLGDAPASVVVPDVAALEPKYLRVTTEAKKREIGDDLRAGIKVAGAYLSTGGIRLTIRKVR